MSNRGRDMCKDDDGDDQETLGLREYRFGVCAWCVVVLL